MSIFNEKEVKNRIAELQVAKTMQKLCCVLADYYGGENLPEISLPGKELVSFFGYRTVKPQNMTISEMKAYEGITRALEKYSYYLINILRYHDKAPAGWIDDAFRLSFASSPLKRPVDTTDIVYINSARLRLEKAFNLNHETGMPENKENYNYFVWQALSKHLRYVFFENIQEAKENAPSPSLVANLKEDITYINGGYIPGRKNKKGACTIVTFKGLQEKPELFAYQNVMLCYSNFIV